MSRDPSDNAGKLPPWLRGVPLPPRPADASEPPPPFAPLAAAPAAPHGATEPLPEWLRDMSAEAGAEDAALPPWLQDAPDRPPPAEPRTPPPPAEVTRDEPAVPAWLAASAGQPQASDAEELPDWLRDLAVEQPNVPAAPEEMGGPPPAEQAQPAEGDDVPDWLSSLSAPSTQASDVGELPGWLREEPAAPAEPPAEQPAPAAPDSPGWLRDLDDTGGRGGEPDVPDWLREASLAAPEAPAAAESAPDTGDTGDVTPLSLAELGIDAPPEAPASPQPDQPAAPSWFAEIGAAADDDAPAWLTAEPRDARGQPPSGEADVPGWLRGLDAAPPDNRPETGAEPAAPAAPPAGDDDVPAWLSAATPLDAAEPTAAPLDTGAHRDVPEGGDQDLPDWLQPAVELAPAAEELPGWLRPADAAAPAADTKGEAPAEDLPDWLKLAADTAPPADAPPPPPTPAPDTPETAGDELPPWLRDEMGQPLPTATPPGDAGLPEWLRGAAAEPPAEVAQSAEAAAPATGEPPTAPTTNGFDWFGDETAAADSSELLGGAELPAWLKAETEPKPEPATVDTRSVDWLTRLGVQDDEAAATVVPAAPRLAPPHGPQRSAAQLEATALLRQLAAAPYPSAEAAPPAAQRSLWRRLGLERALYLLLLLALLAGPLLPSVMGALEAAPVAPGAADIFRRIDALAADDVVLVGYEWDARRISELRPLERAVMDHLIARQVKLVLVSTDPQGTLLLFDLRDQLTAAQYRQNGEGYLLLGYKPGGELALRTMAQDFQSTLRTDFIGNDASVSALATGLDTGAPLTSVRDFAMTVVLADDASDVQAWMEQIRPATDAEGGAPGQPMLFLLPAEAAPIVQPYMAQPDVLSLAGYQGALAYLAQRGGDSGAGVAQAAAQLRFATLTFVTLLLVGGVAAVVSRAIAARRNSR